MSGRIAPRITINIFSDHRELEPLVFSSEGYNSLWKRVFKSNTRRDENPSPPTPYGYVTRWGTPMYLGTPMFGNMTALEGLHLPGKYRDTPQPLESDSVSPAFGCGW